MIAPKPTRRRGATEARPLWYVCDMDEGVLRIEASRRAAVEWWKDQQGASKVVERFTYGPGFYSYLVGHGRDDAADAAIVRADKLPQYGITTAPEKIRPVYPHEDRPHEPREDWPGAVIRYADV